MIQLFEIFDRHAPGTAVASEAEQSGAGTSGGSKNDDSSLTLEFRDNPFASFMRKVRDMIQTNPKEAIRMIENVREARLFNKAHEKESIKNALNRAVTAIEHESPQERQGLVATFFRSVLDLPRTPEAAALHPQDPATRLKPSFTNPAFNPTPFPAFA
jgi:hypothetical protein